MSILKKAFDFYIQSSIHVAVAVFCLVKITIFTSGIGFGTDYSILVFLGTVVGYNFLKYYHVFTNRYYIGQKHYYIVLVTLLSSAGFFYYFINLNYSIQWQLLVAGFSVLVYPFFRKFGWLKLFFVSIVVTYITVWTPLFLSENADISTLFLCLQRFFILCGLLIPFEIMDSKTDSKHLNTLPQMLGIQRTKKLGYGFLLIFVLLGFYIRSLHHLLIDLIVGIGCIIFIHFTSLKNDKYYTAFWVESVPIFWFLLLEIF
jgi:hypothetical protein